MAATLTITDLFTPVQSGVGTNPNTPPAEGTWLATLLQTAAIVQLPTTSWQPGAPERTVLAINAVSFAEQDAIISMQAQGGFFQFAASGTVTTVAVNGASSTEPVTPDPSNPAQNPTGAPGWLDALGQGFFNVVRLQASYAIGPLAVANTTAGVIVYVPGNYHVANPTTGATYSNVESISLASSIIPASGGVIVGMASGNTTTITTTAAHGLSLSDVVYVSGVNGVIGINGAFGVVIATPSPTSMTIAAPSSGAWTSGGQVYLCNIISVQADVQGLSGSAGAGQISQTITQNSGVYVSNVGAISASNWESNSLYVARCQLSLASRSPNGPSQSYEYFALSAQQILSEQTPAAFLTNGAIVIATTSANPITGVVSCLVCSSSPNSTVLGEPVTPGCAQMAVTDATNATPIVVTTASSHNMSTGDSVIISGIIGNTNANGAFTVTVLSSNTFSLNGTTGNGTYAGIGFAEGGDLGIVDNLLQLNCTPDDTIASAVSALAFPITVVATVVVPQQYVSTYATAAQTALRALLSTFPIGGNVPPGESSGTVPISAVEGALVQAGVISLGVASYVREVTSLAVNGLTTDVTYPAPQYVALLVTPIITVVGV